MFDVFANPGYLAVAAALVSAPIIIHLINRMRFKRIRWAAMEFLLKAQKRNRRRLIIEQLILLALRCLLVAMVGLLVMRFVGFSFADFAAKQGLHLVLLDDTLSMTDHVKGAGQESDAFAKAKKELSDKVVKKLALANTKEKLVLLPLSKISERDFEAKSYDRFEGESLKELEADVAALEASKLHVYLLQGAKKVQEIINNNPESRISVYLFSDFRQKDWFGQEGEALYEAFDAMVKDQKDMKLYLFDTAHPDRAAGQAIPLNHDNIGISELRAGTRVAGRAMPVSFTATVTNYSGREMDVQLVIFDDASGQEKLEVDFNPPMPVKVSAFSSLTVNFEMRFNNPPLKAGVPHFEQISARLKNAQLGELEGDGIAADNIRHAAVEVREKVPILVIDGEGNKGRQENKDSFFLRTAIISVPGASYDVVYGDELGGGVAAKALERSDLFQYPTIFLLNVRELTAKQVANLENYVRDGGGVAFFLGPLVSAKQYNKLLYKDGRGIFPAPLKETYYPAPNEEMLKGDFTDEPQLLLREDLLGEGENYPIFGPVFKDRSQRDTLKDVRIKRYFQVPRASWQLEPGKVFEIATLPNSQPITFFQQAALDAVRGPRITKILDDEEYKKYRKGIDRHRRVVEGLVAPGSEKKAYHLADELDKLLQDKGQEKQQDEFPNLTEFWSSSDPKIHTLREEILKLRDQVRYGDPFIVAKNFGKGRVVAVMSTAGKEWNDWAGGSQATLIYQPFIWELQNYLSSQGSEGELTVGTPIQFAIDPEQFKQKERQLKVIRYGPKRPGDKEYPKEEQFGDEHQGQLVFHFEKNHEPGLYVTQLHYADGDSKQPLLAMGHVFNVDTAREGPLQRVSLEDMKKNLIKGRDQQVFFLSAGSPADSLVARQSDFSENPLLYLIFLAILVSEQALAVHLSFHLKSSESDVLARMTTAAQRAA